MTRYDVAWIAGYVGCFCAIGAVVVYAPWWVTAGSAVVVTGIGLRWVLSVPVGPP
jgi:hypothetical protein